MTQGKLKKNIQLKASRCKIVLNKSWILKSYATPIRVKPQIRPTLLYTEFFFIVYSRMPMPTAPRLRLEATLRAAGMTATGGWPRLAGEPQPPRAGLKVRQICTD